MANISSHRVSFDRSSQGLLRKSQPTSKRGRKASQT